MVAQLALAHTGRPRVPSAAAVISGFPSALAAPKRREDEAANGEMGRLTAAMRSRVYEPGHSLYEQGDALSGIYRLESGLVGLRKVDENGASMLLSLVRPGDFIGYGPLLSDEDHLTSAEVLQPSRISFVDARTMRSLMRDAPGLLPIVLRQAIRDLAVLEEKYLQMATQQAHTRLAGLLAALGRRPGVQTAGQSCSFELPILNKDLADLIGIRPETLSRAIGQLRSLGLADLRGRTVHVPSLAKLMHLSGCDTTEGELPLAC